jgi:hypothetical protein
MLLSLLQLFSMTPGNTEEIVPIITIANKQEGLSAHSRQRQNLTVAKAMTQKEPSPMCSKRTVPYVL